MTPRHLIVAWLCGLGPGLACGPSSTPNCPCFANTRGAENDCESPTLCAPIVVDCAGGDL